MERIKKVVLETNGNPNISIPKFVLDRYDLKENDEIEIYEKDNDTLIAKFIRNR